MPFHDVEASRPCEVELCYDRKMGKNPACSVMKKLKVFIMTVKKHYDTHLAKFYSWMTGDFETKANEFQKLLVDNGIVPTSSKNALDLGAGHGLQSIPLAKIGFHVIAVDFSEQLLDELRVNAGGLDIEIHHDDIRNINQFANKEIELIVCCGDTLSHLNDKMDVKKLITDISTLVAS